MTETTIQRARPTARDFLQKFIEIIREMTDVDLRNYEFTDVFRDTLTNMASMKMPIEFCNAIVNVSIRLVSLGGETADVTKFVDAVMETLSVFWGWFVKKFSSRLFLWLMVIWPSSFMKIIVNVLWCLVDQYGPRLWNEYIQPRLRGYVEFATKKIRAIDSTPT